MIRYKTKAKQFMLISFKPNRLYGSLNSWHRPFQRDKSFVSMTHIHRIALQFFAWKLSVGKASPTVKPRIRVNVNVMPKTTKYKAIRSNYRTNEFGFLSYAQPISVTHVYFVTFWNILFFSLFQFEYDSFAFFLYFLQQAHKFRLNSLFTMNAKKKIDLIPIFIISLVQTHHTTERRKKKNYSICIDRQLDRQCLPLSLL